MCLYLSVRHIFHVWKQLGKNPCSYLIHVFHLFISENNQIRSVFYFRIQSNLIILIRKRTPSFVDLKKRMIIFFSLSCCTALHCTALWSTMNLTIHFVNYLKKKKRNVLNYTVGEMIFVFLTEFNKRH